MSLECIADRNQRCRPPAGAGSAPATWLLLSPPRRAGLCCSLTPCSQYDQDVTTWSPQGRIFQIEYAMEAVKQGSAAVGLKVRPQFCLLSTPAPEPRASTGCAAAAHMQAAVPPTLALLPGSTQSSAHAVLCRVGSTLCWPPSSERPATSHHTSARCAWLGAGSPPLAVCPAGTPTITFSPNQLPAACACGLVVSAAMHCICCR